MGFLHQLNIAFQNVRALQPLIRIVVAAVEEMRETLGKAHCFTCFLLCRIVHRSEPSRVRSAVRPCSVMVTGMRYTLSRPPPLGAWRAISHSPLSLRTSMGCPPSAVKIGSTSCSHGPSSLPEGLRAIPVS